jgi:hypothetical protein
MECHRRAHGCEAKEKEYGTKTKLIWRILLYPAEFQVSLAPSAINLYPHSFLTIVVLQHPCYQL